MDGPQDKADVLNLEHSKFRIWPVLVRLSQYL